MLPTEDLINCSSRVTMVMRTLVAFRLHEGDNAYPPKLRARRVYAVGKGAPGPEKSCQTVESLVTAAADKAAAVND
jgi:hypothetical protein